MAKPRGYDAGFSNGFGVGRYRYALAPWQWITDEFGTHWTQPFPVVGAIDLRPLAAQAASGGAPQGFAFVAAMQPQPGVEIATALHMGEESTTSLMQDAWEGAMGYRPQGAKLVDLLWDQLTDGADPTGDAGPKPLMPTVANVLELHVAGHSLVKRERFRFGVHPHTNRVQAVLQRDFERLWEATNGHDHCRRVLDFTCKKYRVDDWREFVPQRLRAHVPGRLPHATTITDDFNRASLGANWTAVSTGTYTGTATISSNTLITSGGNGMSLIRYDATSLSSDDHYCQRDETSIFVGIPEACARFDSAAETYYCQQWEPASGGNKERIAKNVTGTRTNLGGGAGSGSTGTYKISCDGSNLEIFRNGASTATTTDTSITGNARAGLFVFGGGGGCVQDNFEAADLAAPPAGNRRRRVIICGAAA